MTESFLDRPVNRAQFLRNTAKGGLALAVGGSVLASVQGVAYAAGVSDNSTLQAAYAAESLAVHVYEGVLANFSSFKGPKLANIDYFQHALANEKAHKAFLGAALGSKAPTGLTLTIPASALKSGQAVLNFGVALETAFVETYLGAVETNPADPGGLRRLEAFLENHPETRHRIPDLVPRLWGCRMAVERAARMREKTTRFA